jgi:diguanylate cyclase (GGDEF)-like protein
VAKDRPRDRFLKDISASSSLLLNKVAAATSLRDRDDLDRAIADLLLQFLGAQCVALFRVLEGGENKQLVRRVIVDAGLGTPCADLAGEAGKALDLASRPVWQECIDRGSFVEYAGPEGRLVTLVPIRHDREVAGLLAIDALGPLLPRDAELVHGILHIARNHLALLEYSELDTLTGLFNRKTFDGKFDKLRQRLLRSVEDSAARESSWLALVDIDRFKSINDNFGHLFGDEVLLLISQEMKRSFRGADQLFRYGGEEFVIVLDQASDAGAQIALERLRVGIEAREFPQIGRVTVSLGYTRIVAQDIASRCVDRADAALYYAKSHGRNSLRNFEALVAAGELQLKQTSSDIELF